MAVINITWILNKLILRSAEIRISTIPSWSKIVSSSPSDPQNKNGMVSKKSSIFPSSVLRREQFITDRLANIFVVTVATGLSIIFLIIRLICNLLEYVETDDGRVIFIWYIFREGFI